MLNLLLLFSLQSGCLSVEPGLSLGPLRLGMNLKELAALDLPLAPGQAEGVWRLGPFEIQMEKERLSWIALPIGHRGPCLSRGTQIYTQAPQLEPLSALLGPCVSATANGQGRLLRCASGALILEHRGALELRIISAGQPSPPPRRE